VIHGKATLLNEAQVTAVKLNSHKNAAVSQSPKTRLEKTLLIKQAIQLKEEIIIELQQENQTLKEENAAKEQRLAIAEPKAAFTGLALISEDALYMNGAADEKPVLLGDTIKIKRVTKVTQKGMARLAQTVPAQQQTAPEPAAALPVGGAV
jgi:hypothetical protein